MGVVDHYSFWKTAEVAPRVGQKHLAVEPLKRRVELKEQHPRVTQHRRGSLHPRSLAGQLDLMRRGVVLHLLGRLKVITAGRHDRRLSYSMPAAEGGQCLIGNHRSPGRQFFMDPDQVPLATLQEFEHLLPVWRGLLGPFDQW